MTSSPPIPRRIFTLGLAVAFMAVATVPVGPSAATTERLNMTADGSQVEATSDDAAKSDSRDTGGLDASTDWPSGDSLRRELQDIGFDFRVERASGDWLGWAPRATPIEAPAIRLGSEGAAPGWARATFQTLQTDLFGGDADGALTALLEVASRTPLPSDDVSRAFRFIVDDLLVDVPVLQAACYAAETSGGVIVIRLDTETGAASVLLADAASAHPDGEAIADCSPISARVVEDEAGLSRSERLTLVAAAGGRFEPADVEVDGPLVTVVLTVRNDDSVERSLTFAPPLEASTGPIEPGASTLIIVRRLGVGDYAFSGRDSSGILRVVQPLDE